MDLLRLQTMLTTSALNYVVLLASIPAIIKLSDDLQMWGDYLKTANRPEYGNGQTEAFDFIIVGGGSAGAVVANRLSEKHSVLVLEVGADPSFISEIPLLSGRLAGTEMAFTYSTVPQRNCCLSSVNRTLVFPRGKVLGGTSNINGMMYIRGNPKDFDRWASLTADSNWAYENVLPYFKKSQNYHGNYELGSVHAQDGELYIGKLDFEPPVKPYFMEAISEKGYTFGDINAVHGQVFSHPEATIKNGKRWSSYESFLEPILERETLSIYRYSRATKIHLDKNKKAIGVTYIRHGRTHYVEARKEIILSAGVIESPRLLLLSGIGPLEHLESVGIKPEVNLPVGQNYQDHVSTTVTILLNDTVSMINSRNMTAASLFEYVINQKGPLSSANNRIGIGYINSPTLEDQSWPDLYTILSAQGVEPESAEVEGGIRASTYADYYGPHLGKDAVKASIALVRPNSPHGKLKLASNNLDDMPVIDPKIFGDPSDLRRLAEGIMFMVDLFETTAAFRKLNAHVIPSPFPGCERIPFKTREYWECYVQYMSFNGYHAVGSCKMGKTTDPTSVVDSKLRVLNTTGLRVIDASIMPIIVSGNPFASTLMIAELGSDFIKKDWE